MPHLEGIAGPPPAGTATSPVVVPVSAHPVRNDAKLRWRELEGSPPRQFVARGVQNSGWPAKPGAVDPTASCDIACRASGGKTGCAVALFGRQTRRPAVRGRDRASLHGTLSGIQMGSTSPARKILASIT